MITPQDIEEIKGFIYLTFDAKITEDIRNCNSVVNIKSPFGGDYYINTFGYPRYGSVIRPIPIRTRSLNKIAISKDLDKAIASAMMADYKDGEPTCASPIDAAYFYAFAAEWCVLMYPSETSSEKALELSKRCQNQIRNAIIDIADTTASEDKCDLYEEVQHEIIMPLFTEGTYREPECYVNMVDTLNDVSKCALENLNGEVNDENLFGICEDQKYSPQNGLY